MIRNSKKLQEVCYEYLNAAIQMCSKNLFLYEIEKELKSIAQNVTHPFNIAIFGKMKRGKSTLVNALLGRNIAITNQTEATATINIVSYAPRDSAQLNQFEIHWLDSPPECFPTSELKKWNGSDESVKNLFKRIKYLQMYADDPLLRYHEIIDTPGTESVVLEHQEIANSFIDPTIQIGRKADALVYVLGKNLEEADLKYLRKFQQAESSSIDSYNVLAVMHRWDEMYVNEVGKGYCLKDIEARAKSIRKELGSLVLDVIPISAPLAIFLHHPLIKELLEQALEHFSGTSNFDLEEFIEDRRVLQNDPSKVKFLDVLLHDIKLPEPTSWIVIIEAARSSRNDISGLIKRLDDLSGLTKLEEVLDNEFFSRGEIIRQRQICQHIKAVKKKIDISVEMHIKTRSNDELFWEKLSRQDLDDPLLQAWVNEKQEQIRSSNNLLKNEIVELDRFFINSPIAKLAQDSIVRSALVLIEKLNKNEIQIINNFFDNIAGVSSQKILKNDIEKILLKLRRMEAAMLFSSEYSEYIQHFHDRYIEKEECLK